MVPMGYVAWLVDFMRSKIDASALLAGTGIDEKALSEPNAEIADDQHVILLSNVRRLSSNPAIALEMGFHRHIATLDRLGFAMMCCGTFRESLTIGKKYQRVIGRFAGKLLFLSSQEEKQHVVLRIDTSPELGDLAQFVVEEMLGVVISSTRWITGRDLPVRELWCVYPKPAHSASYRKYFSCPIRFNAPCNEIRFDRAFLDTPLPFASMHAAKMYATQCEWLANKSAAPQEQLVGEIRTRLLASASCSLSLQECADALSLSARTLRRKLTESGNSYQDIVNDVKSTMARSYLESSTLTVTEIAARLGFSEPTSFSRAFRLWTGATPREYRSRISR